jgi:hypothetical protein
VGGNCGQFHNQKEKEIVMKILLCIVVFTICNHLLAQDFDGFVITESDSIFKGYMRIVSGGENGTKFLVTKNKKKKPREFFSNELKYYAYKKDTFIYLRNFYPFENADYAVDILEAKVLISNGRLKLYSSTIIPNKKDPNGVLVTMPGGTRNGFSSPISHTYATPETIFIVKNQDGELIGIRKNNEDFIRAMEFIIGDNIDLINKVKTKILRFADMKQIITTYNHSKNEVP